VILRARRTASRRHRSGGVAALELALSLSFLVPLMLAVLDFGYYFYVGATAEEAARQGIQQVMRITGSQACGSAQAIAATNVVRNVYPVGTGVGCLGADIRSAVYCYMNQQPLYMGASGGPTQISTLTCDNDPVNNSWHITVDVSFRLVANFYRALLPAGSTSGTVRYRVSLTASP
jgi:Flp pilus assembly protein TadG